MKIIINLLITAVVAFVLQRMMDNVYIEDFGTAVVFAVVLGLLNTFVKPVLSFFSLPLTIFTFGLFSIVINVGIVLLAKNLVDGVEIYSWGSALVFSILLSVISSVVSWLGED